MEVSTLIHSPLLRFGTASLLLLTGCSGSQSDAPASPHTYLTTSSELRKVFYKVSGGQAVAEGDINLGSVEAVEAVRRDVEGGSRSRLACAVRGFNRYWTDGIVPYVISEGLPPTLRLRIESAINTFNQVTNLTWVPMEGGLTEYVHFRALPPGTAAQTTGDSPVGRTGNVVPIRLRTTPPVSEGVILHEMGHSVGLWHEHTRRDRDQFLIIRWANIAPADRYDFTQPLNAGTDVGAFDFGSIMGYPRRAFGIDGTRDTMTPRDGFPHPEMGQRIRLSPGDVEGLRLLYDSWRSPSLDLGSTATASLAVGRLYGRETTYTSSTSLNRLTVFRQGIRGETWERAQTSAGRPDLWNGWSTVSPGGGEALAVHSDVSSMSVFSVAQATGRLWTRYRAQPAGAWSAWSDLGGGPLYRIAVNAEPNGRMLVFATDDAKGDLWLLRQRNLSHPPTWDPWLKIESGPLTEIVTARNTDGTVEVFAFKTGNRLFHMRQSVAYSTAWTPWYSLEGGPVGLPGRLEGQLVVQADHSGALHVFVIESGTAALKHAAQSSPSGGWNIGWEALSAGGNYFLAVTLDAGNRLTLFSLSSAGRPYMKFQKKGLGTWHGWYAVGNQTGFSNIYAAQVPPKVYNGPYSTSVLVAPFPLLFGIAGGRVYATWEKVPGVAGDGSVGNTPVE